jgi:hypothetical protein
MVKLIECMLHVVGLQFKSSALTFIVDVHVFNIIVTQYLHVTPIEALNGIKVDANHICVFGCDSYTRSKIIMQEVGLQKLKMHFHWLL